MGRGERREPDFSGGNRRGADLRFDASDRPLPGPERAQRRGERRQPTFEPTMTPRRERFEEFDQRASTPRKESGMARRGRDQDDHDDYEEERPRARRRSSGGGGGGGRGGSSRRKRRGFFGRMVYWASVLGVWAFIAVAGLVAYHASKLPPIDSLAVPKRPPNIAILSDDGTLLANRGETGGSSVPLKE